jgi:predicted RNase H-like HicB family nuclease
VTKKFKHQESITVKNVIRIVVLTPTEGTESGYSAACPSLPGCHSQGETRDEALANVTSAIKGFIETLEADKLPVPEDKCEIAYLRID